MRLRTPIILEYRESRVTGSGSTKAVWKQWGSSSVRGCYEADKLSLEGDAQTVERQAQERRGGLVTVRYSADLAAKTSAKWRLRFSPMPGLPDETHLVRGSALAPKGERARFIELKVEREVK